MMMKKIGLMVAGAIVAASMTTQAAVILSEDFETGWYNNKEVQWDANWSAVANNKHFVTTNINTLAAGKFINWRGAQHNTAITGWDVGETVIVKYDMKAFAGSNNNWNPFYMVGLTTNNSPTGANGSIDGSTAGYLWHGLQQWGDNNQVQITGADSTRVGAADVGADFSTADYELDLLTLTFSFEKLANAGDFSSTLMFSNTVSGSSWSQTVTDSNADLWAANSSYLRLMQQNTAMDNSQGNYIDNISVEVIPEPATFGLVAAFGGAVLFIRRRFML